MPVSNSFEEKIRFEENFLFLWQCCITVQKLENLCKSCLPLCRFQSRGKAAPLRNVTWNNSLFWHGMHTEKLSSTNQFARGTFRPNFNCHCSLQLNSELFDSNIRSVCIIRRVWQREGFISPTFSCRLISQSRTKLPLHYTTKCC